MVDFSINLPSGHLLVRFRSDVFIINFEWILHIAVVFPLINLSNYLSTGQLLVEKQFELR